MTATSSVVRSFQLKIGGLERTSPIDPFFVGSPPTRSANRTKCRVSGLIPGMARGIKDSLLLGIQPLRIGCREVAKIHAPPKEAAHIHVPAMKAEVVHDKHVTPLHGYGHRAPLRLHINLRSNVVLRIAARFHQAPVLAPRDDSHASVALIHVHQWDPAGYKLNFLRRHALFFKASLV